MPTVGGERTGSSAGTVVVWDALDEKKRGSKSCLRLVRPERGRLCDHIPLRSPEILGNFAVESLALKVVGSCRRILVVMTGFALARCSPRKGNSAGPRRLCANLDQPVGSIFELRDAALGFLGLLTMLSRE